MNQSIPADPHNNPTEKEIVFPSYHEVIEAVMSCLKENGVLAVLYIDCPEMTYIERYRGEKIYSDYITTLKKTIKGMVGSQIRSDDIITTNHPGGEQFFIFLSYKRQDKRFQASDIGNMAKRINDYINGEIIKGVQEVIKGRTRVYVGHSIILDNPVINPGKLINSLLEDAKKMADYQEFHTIMKNKEKIQELIFKEEIKTVYQPIVKFIDFSIIGYEALTRGPAGSGYENPFILFDVAREANLVFELDRMTRRHALLNAHDLPNNLNIFINCLPSTINDPNFRGPELKALLEKSNKLPKNIVLELTEREAIENFGTFKEALSYYSNLGFAIAVDDAGAGYSSFESLMELKPDYIKIDISLIRDINNNTLKQEMTKALINIGNSMNAIVIAEGIETEEELSTLIDIGITYGQGFLFAKPAFPFPLLSNFRQNNK